MVGQKVTQPAGCDGYVAGLEPTRMVQPLCATEKTEGTRAIERELRARLSAFAVEHAKALYIAKTGATRL